uniref:Uncharacterized protein n=1 Tax=Anguilla anguilla TaxID=7936 RepID=A0A0E9QST7_ANGAN
MLLEPCVSRSWSPTFGFLITAHITFNTVLLACQGGETEKRFPYLSYLT